jgi:hypothetical protein
MTALPRTRPSTLRRWLQGLLWLAAAALAGCGGGGDGGVGTGGTGTYVLGTVSGFGSVIVNGVRFDDSAAEVLDDDDAALGRDALGLGMRVAIDSDAIRTDTTGRSASARRIRVHSELAGPVSAVDTAAGTLVMLGQTVRIGALTVFDETITGALAGIGVGQTIEVYAVYDAARGSYEATRIQRRDPAAVWHLRGPVAALDTAAQRLRIGNLVFDYAAAANRPATLAVGDIVRVRVRLVAGPFGGWVISAFGSGVRSLEDRDEAELEGRIAGFVSATRFSVNGLPVDASAARFPDGSAGLGDGVRVELRGALRGGVLLASEVSIESDDDQRERGFELHGAIQSVDAAGRTFQLRGYTVSWARSDLRLDDGTLDDIRVGRSVEVKAQLAADRSRLEATRIKFE